ncbi:MAG: UvrY/SirA/GacA family response regulator transcription factor [Gammaproteobacteria bacterium]|nr:UvrY/SirA/GacA family response regulator transcription factor [Gammaproteobacteria bacterium]
MIKVLLVDDHDLVRMGISRLLGDVKDIEVIGEATNGEDAIRLAKQLNPEVILMDVNMPGIGGLEAIKRILRSNPEIKILAVTTLGEEPYPTMILQAGANGYLTKGAGVNEMVQAIRLVHAGKRYLSPEVAQVLAMKQLDDKGGSPFDDLSEREMQVLIMITNGQKVMDISEQLHLSPKTVNTYRYRLFEKLNVNSDVELTHLAIRHGLINAK